MTRVADVLAWLKAEGSAETAEGNARFALPTDAYGVPVGAMRSQAKAIGTDHDLALALWDVGGARAYEPRMMAVFLADPKRLTRTEADRWTGTFDNWAICDTACFHLYDRAPFRWGVVRAWAMREEEYVRRAGFAMLWALSVHDKKAEDACFLDRLDLVRTHADDGRTYVKKAIDMALRAIGKRNLALNGAARTLASELAGADAPSARWIGAHARRELTSAKVRERLEGKARR